MEVLKSQTLKDELDDIDELKMDYLEIFVVDDFSDNEKLEIEQIKVMSDECVKKIFEKKKEIKALTGSNNT